MSWIYLSYFFYFFFISLLRGCSSPTSALALEGFYLECVTQKRGLFPRPVELSVCKEGGPAPFGCAGGVQGTGNGFTGEKWDAHPSAQHVQAHVAPDPSPNLSRVPTSRHLIPAEAGQRMANTAKPPRREAGTGSQQKPGFVSLMGSAPVPAGKGKVRGHRCAGREMER